MLFVSSCIDKNPHKLFFGMLLKSVLIIVWLTNFFDCLSVKALYYNHFDFNVKRGFKKNFGGDEETWTLDLTIMSRAL